MKTENHVTDTNQTGETRPGALTPSEAATHATVSVGMFVRRYPAEAVGGNMKRISDVLVAYYVARGFKVGGCSSWTNALRRIQPGEVWLVWAAGQDLRVMGLMTGGNKRRMTRAVLRAFVGRVDSVGAPERVSL